jgi:hypothetical protein
MIKTTATTKPALTMVQIRNNLWMTKRKKGYNEFGMVEKHVMPNSQFFEQIQNGDLLYQALLFTMKMDAPHRMTTFRRSISGG